MIEGIQPVPDDRVQEPARLLVSPVPDPRRLGGLQLGVDGRVAIQDPLMDRVVERLAERAVDPPQRRR